MLYRLRPRVTVFGATDENRHPTGTITRPHPNCWDEHSPVRTSANLSFSRTRSGVVTEKNSSIWNMSPFHRRLRIPCRVLASTLSTDTILRYLPNDDAHHVD